MKVTVVGCGAGAFATAADLTLKGHKVSLYVSEAHAKNFDDIRDDRVIKYYNHDSLDPMRVRIDKITNDPCEAFENPDIILVVTPTFAHEDVARDMADYVGSDDVIILSPGSTGGALVFRRVFDEMKPGGIPKLAEIHTLPYTARKKGTDGVHVMLDVDYLLFAAMPAIYNEQIYDMVRYLYPSVILCADVFETGLNNGNATTHPAPMVLNAGKIEYYGKHSHYSEGITPSVGQVIQAIDDERKAICRAFGYNELDIKDRLYKMGYCPLKETVYECITDEMSVFSPISGPDTLNNRYLTEDAPYSLVAMSNIAGIKNIKTPLMDSVVYLAGALMGHDYMHEGRTRASMGIDGMSVDGVMSFIRTGKK